MSVCKIAIIDDHQVFREGLKMLVEKTGEGKVCLEASNGRQFIEKLGKKKIDIAFMDIEMPVMNGIQATTEVLKILPDLKIIALTTFEDDENLQQMLYAGAYGYMLKTSHYEEFKEAVMKVKQGNHYFTDKVLMKLSNSLVRNKIEEKKKMSLPTFSKREMEILLLEDTSFRVDGLVLFFALEAAISEFFTLKHQLIVVFFSFPEH